MLAAALRGGRGSQLHRHWPEHVTAPTGGRPSGRPRIATAPVAAPRSRPCAWRPPFGAAEDRNVLGDPRLVAEGCDWRPPFGAAEDRNPPVSSARPSAAAWRPPFGAAEDRNPLPTSAYVRVTHWRPPFGAAEDRNGPPGSGKTSRLVLAAALRGGRGSQLHPGPDHRAAARHWRSPFGAAEDRNRRPCWAC